MTALNQKIIRFDCCHDDTRKSNSDRSSYYLHNLNLEPVLLT